MFTSLSKLNREEQDELIMRPYSYIQKVPSKYHKTIGLAFNHWLKVSEDKVNEVGEILHILHTASLLIDDIQDDSKFRYDMPVAHHVYGVGLTLNAVTNVFSIALKKVLELGNPLAIKIYCEATQEGHRGQGIEIYWRDNFVCPTEEEYIDMLKQKSAAFFVFALQMLQLFSDNKENYVQIAVLIGVYYAIRDDYCNLFNRQALKSLAENTLKQNSKENVVGDSDITEGKFTLPIIHAIKNCDKAKEMFNILKQRTTDPTVIKGCISMLEELGSAKYTEDVLRGVENNIHDEIKRLGGNPMLTYLMNELRDWRRTE